MRNVNLTTPLALTSILIATVALAQDPLQGTLTMGMGDVAVIKQKAEAGDAAAQVALGGRIPLAVINGKTLSEGESAAVSVKPGTLTIKCLKIEKDSVLIIVEGEDAPRLLHLR